MALDIHVHPLPMLVVPEKLAGTTAIVIDVLRASSTICHALAYGARAVLPTLEVDDALAAAAKYEAGTYYLGGERQGEWIPGFHLDNSPYSYSSNDLKNKTVIFTTTNGTRALFQCARADLILVGALVNVRACAKAAFRSSRLVHIVCAGTDGEISAEDILVAGAFVAELEALSPDECALSDTAWLARDLFAMHDESRNTLLAAFFASRGGRNLKELGFDDDVERCAERDLFDVAPVFDPQSGEITLK